MQQLAASRGGGGPLPGGGMKQRPTLHLGEPTDTRQQHQQQQPHQGSLQLAVQKQQQQPHAALQLAIQQGGGGDLKALESALQQRQQQLEREQQQLLALEREQQQRMQVGGGVGSSR